jgi:rare lipoprotein A
MRSGAALTFAKHAAVAALALAVVSCATAPPTPPASGVPGAAPAPTPPPAPSSRYYADDGPPERVPPGLDAIPDAVPRAEPLHRFANRPYVVMGREYVPATALGPYRERGMASWYGRKFHGQRTSIGEVYDMFGMTAAHPTLPLPSYARVTNVANGRSVVVRVNDRGPFLHGRIVDLSYAAAHRLDIAGRGSGEVVVEALLPGGATFAAPPAFGQPATAAGAATAPLASAPPVVAAPVPTAAGSPDPAEPAVQAAAGGFVVQLGAFSSEPNAKNFLAHVQGPLASVDVAPRVRQAGGLYRVYVGPYPTRDDARRTAERLAGVFGLATAVAPH